MKKPLVILTGPTAVGKTALSIRLAKLLNAEIISADSMQVYRRMNIGSAKVRPEEMEGVPHHLIDILEPEEEFNVALFKELADKAMEEIYEKGKIPLIVGGTGFYIQAVLNDIDFTKTDADDALRKRLEEEAKLHGEIWLHEKLRAIDPKAAEEIHYNNVKRVIRAIEFFEQTGKKISEHNEEERKKESPYNFAYFVLDCDRALLYERINKRIDLMLEEGLIEEVKGLKAEGCHKEMVSMKGLGYKEILDYLDGVTDYAEAVEILKRDTRRFAKRQLTWFRRENDVTWLEKEDFGFEDEKILEFIIEVLKNKEIINV